MWDFWYCGRERTDDLAGMFRLESDLVLIKITGADGAVLITFNVCLATKFRFVRANSFCCHFFYVLHGWHIEVPKFTSHAFFNDVPTLNFIGCASYSTPSHIMFLGILKQDISFKYDLDIRFALVLW